jgi:hypothetical protein
MPRSSGTTLATNPLPAVRMGKEIGVPMPAHTSAIAETSAADGQGRLHLFLTVQRPHEWATGALTTLYFVADGKSVAERGTAGEISKEFAPTMVKAEDGRTHVFVRGDPAKMMGAKSGDASKDEPVLTPAVAQDPSAPCGIAGGDPVCGYLEQGPRKGGGVSWQLALGLVGGPMGGLPILLPVPYRETAYTESKVTVVRLVAGRWVPLAMLDTQTARAAQQVKLAGDNAGDVHVLYTDLGNGRPSLAYALIKPGLTAANNDRAGAADEPSVTVGHTLRTDPVSEFDLAVDPKSGTAQIALIEKERAVVQPIVDEEAGAASVLAQGAIGVRLASAGEDRFHALIALANGLIVYRLIGPGVISAAVDVGNWSSAPEAGFITHSAPQILALAAETSGNAFAIWQSSVESVSVREISLGVSAGIAAAGK